MMRVMSSIFNCIDPKRLKEAEAEGKRTGEKKKQTACKM